MQKIHHKKIELTIPENYHNNNRNNINLRNESQTQPSLARYEGYKHSFFNRSITAWNRLDKSMQQIEDTEKFIESLMNKSYHAEKHYNDYIIRLGINSLISDLEDTFPYQPH